MGRTVVLGIVVGFWGGAGGSGGGSCLGEGGGGGGGGSLPWPVFQFYCPVQHCSFFIFVVHFKHLLYLYYGFSLCIGIIFFIISRWRLQTEGTGSMGLEPRAVCLKGRSLAYMSPHATHWVQSLP